MKPVLRQAFENEWSQARAAREAGQLDVAFAHLERAHILGQAFTWPHVKSHLGMLHVGWLRADAREIFGQLTRIVAASVFTRFWVPVGNTGGANVSPTQPMPIPADLQAILDQAQA